MKTEASYSHPVILADRVLELGTLAADEEFIVSAIASSYDGWSRHGCSAVAREVDGGNVLVGRTMDLSISEKPAYTFTVGSGKYRARGLAYSHLSGDDFEKAKDGISEDFAKLLPFGATDYINENGLYIEINMRGGELDPEGRSMFGCSGTCPGAKLRLPMFSFGGYAATRCGNVREVLELVREIDLFTPKGTPLDWNFAFLVADKDGCYGVIEAICNELYFTTYENGCRVCYDLKTGDIIDSEKTDCNAIVQTNFFTVKKYEEKESSGAGYGRYAAIMDGIMDVNTIEEMKTQMGKVLYSQSYQPYGSSKFDVRSEWCDTIDGPDGKKICTRWLLDEKNREEAERLIKEAIAERSRWTHKEKVDSKNYWFSDFWVVADCRERKLHVTFWEDESTSMVLGL